MLGSGAVGPEAIISSGSPITSDSMREITDEGKVDYLKASGPNFAFSFKWRLIKNQNEYYRPDVLFQKKRKLKFVRTHKPRNHGPNIVIDESGKCLNHYIWVKPTERMRIRHQTSGFYNGMLKWFNENWDKLELIENKKVNYYGGTFRLERYDGSHPKILKDHPWRNIKDIMLFK